MCGTSHRCSSWTRLDCPLLCSLCSGPDSAVCAVLDKVVDCPLLCSLCCGPDSAVCAVLDKVVDLPVIVQRQVYVVGQSRKLWRSRSCNALMGDDVPVVQVVDRVSWKVPQIQFIARVCGPSSFQRDVGLSARVWRRCWGGHVSRSSGLSRS